MLGWVYHQDGLKSEKVVSLNCECLNFEGNNSLCILQSTFANNNQQFLQQIYVKYDPHTVWPDIEIKKAQYTPIKNPLKL